MTPEQGPFLRFPHCNGSLSYILQDALEAEGWNVVDTARRLDLARSHVYNLIRAFGLERGRR